jgi:DNA-directed RNA polymerase specialized sigma24 family protein
LDDEPWEEHLETLTLYAQRLISYYNWQGGTVLGGKEAPDFAQEAITDLLEAKRNWNPVTHPSLLKFLLAAVKSEVYNATRSKISRERKDDSMPEKGKSDDDTVIEILEFVEDDADLTRYVEAVIDGCSTRDDIADHLNLKHTDVDNLRRRMERRYNSFYKEIHDNGN